VTHVRTLGASMGGQGGQIRRAVRQWDRVREFALSFPMAFEDFPWGVPVVKVATGSKWPPLFLWLGARDADAHAIYMKLTDSYEQAVAIAGASPTAMSGVGQWGRLTVRLPVSDVDLLFDWVDESYRNVAPKRLVALLDSRVRGR
jgi:predicted DNA-binding protein (MmcQ/YjbR family)